MDMFSTLREFLKGRKTYLTIIIGLLYLAGVWAGIYEFDEKVLAVLGLSALAFLRAGLGKSAPLVILSLCLVSCAPLQPEANPLVVRVEQTQQTARATFDLILAVNHTHRDFWRTNAPAYHQFCEWLRAPITYDSPEYGPTNIPRALMLQFQLDDLKTAYLAARASSNDLYTALATFRQTLDLAQAWESVILAPRPE
jgi:hypothetical protein